jgi:hypothetical protein
MSRQLVAQQEDGTTWVCGWDNMLQSYFLQKYVPNLPEDVNPVLWLGADAETRMYELEELVDSVFKHSGIILGTTAKLQLYQDRDEGL